MSTRPKHVMPLCRETGADGRTNQTGRANDNDAHAETSFRDYTLGRAWARSNTGEILKRAIGNADRCVLRAASNCFFARGQVSSFVNATNRIKLGCALWIVLCHQMLCSLSDIAKIEVARDRQELQTSETHGSP
jgi:hypothetical protein